MDRRMEGEAMSLILKGLDIPKEYSVIIEIDEYGEVCEHIKGDQIIHIKPWAKAIQIPYDVEDIVDDVVENHEPYKKGGWII